MKRRSPNAQAKADVLFARLVRGSLNGRCFADHVRPTCAGYIQCCHIISRSYHAIRWDFDNAVPMCAAHHMYFTHHPLEWRDFIEARAPGLWDSLREKALTLTPRKAADVLADLRLA
jgi:hypothetical protein